MIIIVKYFILNYCLFFRKLFRKNKTGETIVVSYSLLGDTVLTIPALKQLKQKLGGITIFCFKTSKEIYELEFGNSINYFTVTNDDFYFNRIAKTGLRKRIKALKPFRIIDLSGDIRSVTSTFTSGASKISGIAEYSFRKYYDEYSEYRKTPHLSDMYLDAVNIVYGDIDYTLYKSYKLNFICGKNVLIHPFAGWKAKEWPLSKFAQLAVLLKKENFNALVVIPADFANNEIINIFTSKEIEIIKTETISHLVKVINECSYFVANDTGPVHIAALLGKPTFTLFGPTNPQFIINNGKHHSYIQKQIKCIPTGDLKYCHTDAGRKGCSSFECMNDLSVAEVFNKFLIYSSDIYMNS